MSRECAHCLNDGMVSPISSPNSFLVMRRYAATVAPSAALSSVGGLGSVVQTQTLFCAQKGPSVAEKIPPTAAPSAPTSTVGSAGQATARKPQQQQQAHHKLSSNVGDASTLLVEDIPYATLSNWAFRVVHARRILVPLCTGAAAYALLPGLVAAGTLSTMHCVTLGCVFAVLQRLNVRGAANGTTKDLRGTQYIVTGGTSGIGLAVVQQLVGMGASVCVVSRPGKESATKEALAANLGAPMDAIQQQVSFVSADFADQAEVALAVQKLKAKYPNGFNGLVNCAGVYSESPKVTKQNVEEHIGTNFLAPFHITEGLLPVIRKFSASRIVYVTCAAHFGARKHNVVQNRLTLLPSPEVNQITVKCYSASKLGNILHARNLAGRRYEGATLQQLSKDSAASKLRPFTVCTVDPGTCSTHLDRSVEPFLGTSSIAKTIRSLWVKDPVEGSQTIMHCLLANEVDNGGHYYECRAVPSGVSRMAHSPRETEDVCRWAKHKLERFLSNS